MRYQTWLNPAGWISRVAISPEIHLNFFQLIWNSYHLAINYGPLKPGTYRRTVTIVCFHSEGFWITVAANQLDRIENVFIIINFVTLSTLDYVLKLAHDCGNSIWMFIVWGNAYIFASQQFHFMEHVDKCRYLLDFRLINAIIAFFFCLVFRLFILLGSFSLNPLTRWLVSVAFPRSPYEHVMQKFSIRLTLIVFAEAHLTVNDYKVNLSFDQKNCHHLLPSICWFDWKWTSVCSIQITDCCWTLSSQLE